MTNTHSKSSRHNLLVGYLSQIESSSIAADRRHNLLWPTTPIGEAIQERIRAMVGVADSEVDNPRCRTCIVLSALESLVSRGNLPADFSLLDVACGDARIVTQIKRRFPAALVSGLDCHQFPAHAEARAAGVRLYHGYLQTLFETAPPGSAPSGPFDVVMMLNTFRNWRSARLPAEQRRLPQTAEAWLYRHSRFAIVTAAPAQIERLSQTRTLRVLGDGEEGAKFVIVEGANERGGDNDRKVRSTKDEGRNSGVLSL